MADIFNGPCKHGVPSGKCWHPLCRALYDHTQGDRPIITTVKPTAPDHFVPEGSTSVLFGKPVPEGWGVDEERGVVIKPSGRKISFELWRDHKCGWRPGETGCEVCGAPGSFDSMVDDGPMQGHIPGTYWIDPRPQHRPIRPSEILGGPLTHLEWARSVVDEHPPPSQEDEDSLITYVKHSVARTPCGACHTTGLLWAHEVLPDVKPTGMEQDYCNKCKTFGPQVLVDPEPSPTGKYKPHACQESKPAGTAGSGDAPDTEADAAPLEENERPDLAAPDAEDDPWANPGKPSCGHCGEQTVDAKGICESCGMDSTDQGQQDQQQDSQSSLPEPPWKQDDQEDQTQNAGPQQFSDPDDEDDEHVKKVPWFEARTSDGEWLKEHAEKRAGEAMKYASEALMTSKVAEKRSKISDKKAQHALTAARNAEDAAKKNGEAWISLEAKVAQIDRQVLSLGNRPFSDEAGLAASAAQERPTEVTLITPGKPDKPLPELHHRDLPTLTKLAHGRIHVLMVGEASVGKGQLAEQVATALDLDYYELPASLSPQTTVSQIMGYMQADGSYIRTLFREAVEHGGVMFLDEMDNANSAALASINGILAKRAGRKVAFPDGMVEVHENFVVMGAANTYGRGANQTYAARQRGDAATWDRFQVLTVEIDEILEMTLCHRTGAPNRTVAEVVRFVRALRRQAAASNLPVVLGMRTTIDMCRSLMMGVDLHTVVDMRCRRGLSDQDWANLTGDVRDIELDAPVEAAF